MSGVWGEFLKLSIFGESHGKCIGIVINGLPAGLELDLHHIQKELGRRAPGKSQLATARQEDDAFEIVSGYLNNRTTGAPLSVLIWNKDQHSRDYEEIKDIMRPGHADFTARNKFAGFNDYRGGGHFSGRLTAPLVLAGAIGKQILSQKGIVIGSHILRIGNIEDTRFNPVNADPEKLLAMSDKPFPVISEGQGQLMQEHILQAKMEQDSVGGIVEAAIVGLPAGIGSPFFDSVESKLAHLLFSIPAVKGVEFGTGFAVSGMRGSEANDEFTLGNGEVRTMTNHCGGIQGGITNGMPLIFRTAFKPTPSIARGQRTVDIVRMEEVEIHIQGRHDPCIVPRAVPVVEAVAAIALLDMIIEKDGSSWKI
ncbi:MAG: Chorismate synthase [Candidatus Dichloromethanomonas elyunquensis]|nr:MAG: Chorismate synthase [Candidatus Dichloromethanomonas elyunquensis]